MGPSVCGIAPVNIFKHSLIFQEGKGLQLRLAQRPSEGFYILKKVEGRTTEWNRAAATVVPREEADVKQLAAEVRDLNKTQALTDRFTNASVRQQKKGKAVKAKVCNGNIRPTLSMQELDSVSQQRVMNVNFMDWRRTETIMD